MKRALYCATVLILVGAAYNFHALYTQIGAKDDLILQKNAEIGALKNKVSRLQQKVQDPSLPVIYVITPTYKRPVQRAELTRLQNVFGLVQNLHWIVVEDASKGSDLVQEVLKEFPNNSTMISIPTPEAMKIQPKETWWKKPRGVYQRNLALSWLRENAAEGVIYFADDDNTYTVDLFEEIRYTTRVSVLPVGLVGGVLVEKPRVSGGKVIGWDVGWGTDRPFATDMAGFAINLSFFLKHKGVKFQDKVKVGNQESAFLTQLVKLDDLEPVGLGRVLVWHTRTEKPNLNREQHFKKKYGHSSDFGLQV